MQEEVDLAAKFIPNISKILLIVSTIRKDRE